MKHLSTPRPDEALAAAQAFVIRMRANEVELVIERLRELSSRRQLILALLPAFTPHT